MKALQYITISLFILASLLVGSVSYGQVRGYTFWRPRTNDTTISLDTVRKYIAERSERQAYFDNFKQFEDSVDANHIRLLKCAANNSVDSCFYYKGRIDVFYELCIYWGSKYLKKN